MSLISGIPLPRNTLFRPRSITIVLDTGVPLPIIKTKIRIGNKNLIKRAIARAAPFATSRGIQFPKEESEGQAIQSKASTEIFFLKLTEVTTVRIVTTGGTAVAMGVVAPILQPWYFQPVQVEITGQSYMGAFSSQSLNVTVDDDIERLLNIRNRVNKLFLEATTSIQNLKTILTIGEPERGSIGTNQKFIGFINEINIEESQDVPYTQRYIIKFIGEFSNLFNLRRGADAINVERKEQKATGAAPIKDVRPAPAPSVFEGFPGVRVNSELDQFRTGAKTPVTSTGFSVTP